MTGAQRAVLTTAAVLLLIVTFVQVTDPTGNGWLALVAFLASVACFFFAFAA